MLIRQLARELHAAWSGQRVLAVRFDREHRTAHMVLENGTWQWSLFQGPSVSTSPDQGRTLTGLRHARVAHVGALPDERVLRIELVGGARNNAVATLLIELLPPQPNIIALDAEERVLKMLTPSAGRPQTRGQKYQAPAPLKRLGLHAPIEWPAWLDLLGHLPPPDRAQVLVARVAYTSPINALPILGAAGDDEDPSHLRSAYDRYCEVRSAQGEAFLLDQRKQPYSHALWQSAQPFDSLLAAFAHANAAPQSHASERLERAIAHAQRKRSRLEAELEQAAQDANRLRQDAELLLAHVHAVPRGMQQVELLDFQGQPRRLQLDPALNAAANAQAWYAEARKRDRAAQRLPSLIKATDRRLIELRQALEAGGDVDQPPAQVPRRSQRSSAPSLPYRRFRTSGGLEVRVGRNGRANDDLTFHHSAPNDIWMHARDVGGAHVVLRWNDADANPPRRDLEQAAGLAALHSKARHSGVVPVDWTRRKHVRKPRQAAAGTVRIERVKTIFVKPEASQLESLQWADDRD